MLKKGKKSKSLSIKILCLALIGIMLHHPLQVEANSLTSKILIEREFLLRYCALEGQRRVGNYLCDVTNMSLSRVGLMFLEPYGFVRSLVYERHTMERVYEDFFIPTRRMREELRRGAILLSDVPVIIGVYSEAARSTKTRAVSRTPGNLTQEKVEAATPETTGRTPPSRVQRRQQQGNDIRTVPDITNSNSANNIKDIKTIKTGNDINDITSINDNVAAISANDISSANNVIGTEEILAQFRRDIARNDEVANMCVEQILSQVRADVSNGIAERNYAANVTGGATI